MKPAISSFTKALVQTNRLDFVRWHFEDGMRHGDSLKWWDNEPRDAVHNGLDLIRYVNSEGAVLSLPPGTRIPLMYNGELMNIIDDFLNRSVIFSHGTQDVMRLVSVYGHVKPVQGLSGMMDKESIIATIADTRGKTAPPHLHLSLFLLPEEIMAEEINWDYLSNNPDVRSLDPLKFI